MREEVYDISGMHCAACSASVEKVTRRLPGVERSDVNLVAERMTIVYDETQVTPEQIIAKVEKAGFGAKLHQEKQEAAPVQTGEDPEELELRRKKRELIVSAIFSCALLYVSMGQMLPFGLPALPLPDLFSMHTHPTNFAVLQLILAVPVLYCGRNFFQGGFKSLFHGNPNMDSLVAIGSGCSFAYSLVMTFLISDDPSYVHNLYYESAAVVLTLVSLGKFLESRNMQKTKGAITALMQLSPDTAILADTGREVPTSQLKVGDVVLVKPGARVPADGTVTQGESSVNEAMLTGESLPVEKAVDSEVIGGSVNENGVLYVQVTRTGDDSTLSRIIRFPGPESPDLQDRRQSGRCVRAGGHGHRAAGRRHLGHRRAALLLCAAGVHIGAGHRLPLCPGVGNSHRHHGRHGPGGQAWYPDPLRRDSGDHPQRGHGGAGQDRHRHRGHPRRDGGPTPSV